MSSLYIYYIFIVPVNVEYVRKACGTAMFLNFVYVTVTMWVCVQGDLHVDERVHTGLYVCRHTNVCTVLSGCVFVYIHVCMCGC